ncbi:MAG: SDR family oxidoreductase [Bacteroidales bacterium]|nr:SDR family oxidoreductase [Bacteroidales bacterium]
MKTVLITGASSGIGKELSYVFAANGFNLVLVARRTDKLDDIKNEIFEKHQLSVEVISMDLSMLESADLLFNEVKSRELHIDVLINNAGFGISAKFEKVDAGTEEQMMILNMISLTKLSRLFGAKMIDEGEGHIINISSAAAFQSVPGFSSYAASKAYVLSFSEAIEYELRPYGVNVTTICPGATKSEFAAVASANEKIFAKAPTSLDLAHFTFNAFKKNKGTVANGLLGNIMIFGLRFTPRKMATKIAAMMMK